MSTVSSRYSVPASVTGNLDPDIAGALAGLLGAPTPDAQLPPFWHWTYLLERPRQESLGADGHPAPGDAGTTRMFAGGRLTTLAPLRLGRPAHRASAVQKVQTKSGRSGELTFVTVRHEIAQDDAVCLIDEQDLVYRPATGFGPSGRSAGPAVRRAPSPSAVTLRCDPVLLFRFSALTYNAHRIHYDLEFARAAGYPGLVIHGPLQVLLMAETLRRAGHRFEGTRFEYRLVAPAFAPRELRGSVEPPGAQGAAVDTAVRTAEGTTTAIGRLLALSAG